MRELLTVPLPPADDLSSEAQSKRELLLLVAETAIGHARKAEEIMLRGDGAWSQALNEGLCLVLLGRASRAQGPRRVRNNGHGLFADS